MKNKCLILSISLLLSMFVVFISCGSKQEKVEKIMEDGVEVVVNHQEPYKIKGKLRNLSLEEELVIDTELEKISEIGIANIDLFDVDSERNIYLSSQYAPEYFIYKFDEKGNFIKRFGRKGQGPGEFQFITSMHITDNEEIVLVDQRQRRLITFSLEGNLIRQEQIESRTPVIMPLSNGNNLVFYFNLKEDPEDKYYQDLLLLYDSNLEKIKELDRFKRPNGQIIKKRRLPSFASIVATSRDNIYLGNEDRGYEIWVFDLDGNLKRKIRKEYNQTPITEEFKNKYMKWFERMPVQDRDRYYFTKFCPPYQLGFSDEEGRLFVMTYEGGIRPGEYMYDVFDFDGVFITRIGLGNYGEWPTGYPVPLDAKAKNNRIYCLKQMESGYKELVAYRIKWEY